MTSKSDKGFVLVTGAGGHIGREVCRLLRAEGSKVLPVDLDGVTSDLITCDLRLKDQVLQLFRSYPIRAVIHLAGVLPSSFHSNPFAGVDVNLTGCFELMRQAVHSQVKRFVFASSISVYGLSVTPNHPLTEHDPAIPDEPYGASKRVVELVGDTLASGGEIEFVSLRIARVIGLGIKKTSSPWRSQIFGLSSGSDSIHIPFAPEAVLSLVHVDDVARMLVILAETPQVASSVYNTPVELWEARWLKEVIEKVRHNRVELGQDGVRGGPICDGSRFAREFGVQLRGLRERLSDCPPRAIASHVISRSARKEAH
jgi:nucleoside-diphosphate-sugar epimerase